MEVEYLGGGVSNIVARIKSDLGVYVLKQALPRLKVKVEWLSDVERAHVEKKVLELLPTIVPGQTPALVFDDPDNFLFMMESAPDGAMNWKQLLMKGECDNRVASQAGQFLGEVHAKTKGVKEIATLFDERKYFHQLRIDPFFFYLMSTYPEIGSLIQAHIAGTWSRRECLVFGDYSPKNILVFNDRIMPIDFEVAHYGDPSFDLGFLWAHLVLKAIHFSDYRYVELLDYSLKGYQMTITPEVGFEERAVQQLGYLLLARMDGKSPVDYFNSQEKKDIVRKMGKTIIMNGSLKLKEVSELVSQVIQ
jgi:tRNA A-37 threonylcarbamoyl transferase component Bud32